MAFVWKPLPRLATLLVAAIALSACSRASTSMIGAGAESLPGPLPVAGPASGGVENTPGEVRPEEDAPALADPDPQAGPVNLPGLPTAPTAVVEPANMVVRSVAETLTVGVGAGKAVIVRARVTWTPVRGVQRYRVHQQAVRDDSAPGQMQLLYTLPKWVPVAIAGGAKGLLNLNVGQEYRYLVEGLDAAGNVICRGQDHCRPMPPLEVPTLVTPAANEARTGQTPTFRWTEVRGSDGYYVQAFGLLNNQVPALPMWRGFRKDQESINLTYGQQVDVFDGTRPMQWALPLSVGTRYAWTVCALRTDTHAMHTAKAIARATAPMAFFTP